MEKFFLNPKYVFKCFRAGMSYKQISNLLHFKYSAIVESIDEYRKNYEKYNPEEEFIPKIRRHTGRNWTREKARMRDNWICQDCKKVWIKGSRRFDIHHLNGLCGKKSRAYDKVSEIDGLVTLCHKCHFNRPEHTVKKNMLLKLESY